MRRSLAWHLVAACSLLCASPLTADDWPQFLGPNRNGISSEKGLLETWPTAGPKELWRVPGGVGMAGLAIQGGKLVTLVQKDGKQFIVAKNRENGATLWGETLASQYENKVGTGPGA